jgi:two-component system sensor histidine kinase DesK
MTGIQFPPYIVILAFSAVLTASLALHALKTRDNKAHLFFGLAYLTAGLWPALYAFELFFTDEHLLNIIAPFKGVGIQFFQVLFLLFIYQTVEQRRPPKFIFIPAVLMGAFCVFGVLTDNIFHLMWSGREMVTTEDGYVLLIITPSKLTLFTTLIYHYGIGSISMYLLIKGFIHGNKTSRAKFLILMASIVSAAGVSFLYLYNVAYFGYYNPIPVSIGFASVLASVAVFRYGLLNIVPYSREDVFDVIDNPVLILDEGDRLLDFNLSAGKFFRLNKDLISSPLRDISLYIGIDLSSITEISPSVVRTSWGTGENHIFSVRKKQVVKNDVKGYLMVFSDITAQLNSIKIAHEKEIVAYKESILGDMHDGIGGVVATAAMIAQSALENDDTNEKNKNIKLIASLLENGSFELRSMLNILDKSDIDWNSLVADMRAFSSTVLDSKNIKRKMRVEGEVFTTSIDFNTYLSIFRLFKELITNIIKHSEAEKVEITLTFKDKHFRMLISDDGIGLNDRETKGYGMKNMMRRVEKLHGTIEISSKDGTTIDIQIPTV